MLLILVMSAISCTLVTADSFGAGPSPNYTHPRFLFRHIDQVNVISHHGTLRLTIPLPFYMQFTSSWRENLCRGNSIPKAAFRSAHTAMLEEEGYSGAELRQKVKGIELEFASLGSEQYDMLSSAFVTKLIEEKKLPVNHIFDDKIIDLIVKKMNDSHNGMDREATRRMLIDGEIQVHGCYDDALIVSTPFPSVDFSGELYEMKDQGSISPKNAIFQHFVVNNRIIERLLPNGTFIYYGVDLKDCSFLFGDTRCTKVHRRCIPSDMRDCETAFIKLEERSMIRPIGPVFMIATAEKSYRVTTNGVREPLPRPVPSRIFTLEIPENSYVEIDKEILTGMPSINVFNYNAQEEIVEHPDDRSVPELRESVDQYADVKHRTEETIFHKLVDNIIILHEMIDHFCGIKSELREYIKLNRMEDREILVGLLLVALMLYFVTCIFKRIISFSYRFVCDRYKRMFVTASPPEQEKLSPVPDSDSDDNVDN